MNRTIKELFKVERMFYAPLIPNNTVEGLCDMCMEIVCPDFVIVEIGSFSGVSSDLLSRFCKELICIDFWENSIGYVEIPKDMLERAHREFNALAETRPNITKVLSTSLIEAEKTPDKSIDMVYIDGRHDEDSVRADIKAWLPKVKSGGWVTGHDIDLGGVQVPVKELLGNNYKSYKDTSWAVQIK